MVPRLPGYPQLHQRSRPGGPVSFTAVEWALNDSPVISPTERLVLGALAEKSDSDGCNAFRSKKTLAACALVDLKTVQRTLRTLETRGLIKPGDQKAAAYIDPRYRPRVYDIQIPYSWFGTKIHRVNEDRASKGRPPLTAADRPDLAPAPERAARSDKGQKAPQRRPKSLGPKEQVNEAPDSRGDFESPLPEELRGDYESLPEGIENPFRGDSESPNSVRELCPSNSGKSPLPAVGGVQHRKGPDATAVPAGKEDLDRGQEQPEQDPAAGENPHRPDDAAPVSPALAVCRSLPAEIQERVSKSASGKVLAIAQRELTHRSIEELVDRIGRRWLGWQVLNPDGRISDGVALAITLIQRGHCANVRCEDGFGLDDGLPCKACADRPRRTAPAPARDGGGSPPAVPAPRQAAPAVAPTPTAPPFAEVQAKLAAVSADTSSDPEPAPKPSRARGDRAQEAINAARASLGRGTRSDRHKAFEAARRVECPACKAAPGAPCRNRDDQELILVNTHSARVAAKDRPQDASEDLGEPALTSS
ncbi:helix-turn-helix domain-containing protein [Streptosporangium roseum]|uniref:helix-turn-helix domain-containing protein n=1 Tax=Streptosporangium roseum TaxID=2001 RepID=UPI00332C8C50